MANHHHHHHQRPHRLSVPPRSTSPTTFSSSPTRYPSFPYTSSSSTPTATPSKTRLSTIPSFKSSSKSKSSLSFLFLLLLSLRSLYSLLPFLRSSPSFSLFPFSFLLSLLSFLLTLSFSLFSSHSSLFFSSSNSLDPFNQHKPKQPLLALSSLTHSQQRLLVAKSVLLALVFLLRFQALRYCGTAATILAEFTGTVAARFFAERRTQNWNRWRKLRGFGTLILGLFMLAFGWDKEECFPLSNKLGKMILPSESCVAIWPMLLPFVAGFIGCYERISMDWGTIRQLGQKRVRLITLFFTTIVLLVPALVSFFVFESEEDSVSFGDLAWPLVNTVAFAVILSENYTNDEKLVSSKDTQREYLVTFVCILLLQLFYFPELSLWGLLLCGLLLYIAVRDLDPFRHDVAGSREESSEFLSDMIMKPIRHILSERKSRKIALFLLINTGYMVVEFVAGFMSNSLGLISDACHMLFDCAALAIGLYASYISRLPANNYYYYGRGRFEVLSGYANAVFLVLVGALIVVESFERILDPQEISTSSLLVVSIGGLLVNVIGLIFFHEEHHHAHGGSGSCSHSHSHSHSELHTHHSHHSHGKQHHHHAIHGSNQEQTNVSGGCQENSCHGDSGNHHHCNHPVKGDCHADSHGIQSIQHHENTNCHEHQHKHHHNPDHHHANHHCHEASVAHCLDVIDVAKSHCEGVNSTGHCDSELWESYTKAEEQREHSHHHIDHNMEGIFLHVLADTMGSVGVVISTLLIKYKGWLVADPACSIFISVLIVSSVIPLLRNSAEILLQRVPRAHELELKDVLTDIVKIKGVSGIQKFHVWSLTNTDVVGTLHLHVSTDSDKVSAKSQVSRLLHNAGIKDLTLQVECVR
ncbi:hypothetical protein HN51_016884 [Arachis hypogaea]|uniref:Cation efflux protein transmembrane domain-containing protein n=1 Tax=Arachis hypogaea TaxID=3818 RepID=A0A445CV23_ARAHY|nr:zinc transporter 5 [Arachis hypogaea]QHO47508.1 Metal tolerance protein [Arachis hypogaea]RYR54753.1 hypothetical protein Ahy_A06g030037 isoform B [Arachis hypogaea]